MAKIVIRCQYTGHYVVTGIDTATTPSIAGGRIFCPYCIDHHVWNCTAARADAPERPDRPRALVRQAS
jgi:hypothetical protein